MALRSGVRVDEHEVAHGEVEMRRHRPREPESAVDATAAMAAVDGTASTHSSGRTAGEHDPRPNEVCIENTVDVVESAERESAPVVEPADDARPVPSHVGSELARRRTPARTGATPPTTASGRGASAAARDGPATACARLIAVIPVLTSGESALFGSTSPVDAQYRILLGRCGTGHTISWARGD